MSLSLPHLQFLTFRFGRSSNAFRLGWELTYIQRHLWKQDLNYTVNVYVEWIVSLQILEVWLLYCKAYNHHHKNMPSFTYSNFWAWKKSQVCTLGKQEGDTWYDEAYQAFGCAILVFYCSLCILVFLSLTSLFILLAIHNSYKCHFQVPVVGILYGCFLFLLKVNVHRDVLFEPDYCIFMCLFIYLNWHLLIVDHIRFSSRLRSPWSKFIISHEFSLFGFRLWILNIFCVFKMLCSTYALVSCEGGHFVFLLFV